MEGERMSEEMTEAVELLKDLESRHLLGETLGVLRDLAFATGLAPTPWEVCAAVAIYRRPGPYEPVARPEGWSPATA